MKPTEMKSTDVSPVTYWKSSVGALCDHLAVEPSPNEEICPPLPPPSKLKINTVYKLQNALLGQCDWLLELSVW